MTGGLFGSGILDVVIGLVFIYFVYSVVCSGINEILAGLFKWRARDLELAIVNMLCDSNLAATVMKHPLIKGMGSTNQENPLVRRLAGPERSGKPDYIPARTFSLALFDTLVPAESSQRGPLTADDLRQAALQLALHGQWVGNQLQSEAERISREAQETGREIEREVQVVAKRIGEDVADSPQAAGKALLALIDASQRPGSELITLEQIKKVLHNAVDPARRDTVDGLTSLAQIRAFIQENAGVLPGGAQRQALQLIDDMQKELDAVRASVELWFDHAMDRLSGVYKRRVQVWLLAIAAVITLLSGADTFQIVRGLQRDPTIRNVLVQEAGRATAAPQPGAAAPTAASAISDPALLSAQLDQIQPLIGYSSLPQDVGGILLKILGLLVTMGAISMGAPFWFQVLQKAANLRNASPQPLTSTQLAASGDGKP